MAYARVVSNVVTEVLSFNPVGVFHEDAARQFAECPDEVQVGWSFDGGVYIPPVPFVIPLETRKQAKTSDLADRRYQAETAGVTVAGVKVATDRESQASLTGAYTSMKAGLVTTIDWKGDDGWVVLDLPTCEALAQAVANHVQQCFTREKVLAEQIDAAQSIEALEAIDIGSGWPA